MVVGEALRGLSLLCIALALAASCGGKTHSTTDGTAPGQGGAGAIGAQGGAGSVGPSSGGAASAGHPGVSSGGAYSAGSGGKGGGAGTSAGGEGGAPASATCAHDEDCRLFDCCSDCESLAPDEPDPYNCAAVDCDGRGCQDLGLGATSARCLAGRCVLSHSCNPAVVIEPSIPAPCPPGRMRVLTPDVAGGCVPVTECSDVGSCAPCEEAGLFCTTIDWGALTPTGSMTYHCVSVPPECNGEPSCECMQTCGFEQTCSESGQFCVRFCPNC